VNARDLVRCRLRDRLRSPLRGRLGQAAGTLANWLFEAISSRPLQCTRPQLGLLIPRVNAVAAVASRKGAPRDSRSEPWRKACGSHSFHFTSLDLARSDFI
jgi:hypothetical protein